MNQTILSDLSCISEEEKQILQGQSLICRDLYMPSGSDIIRADRLLSEGKLITVRPHTRFVHFPEHSHDYIEVVYMCKGQTTHIINGEPIVLGEGELLFLSQNARQEILPAGQEDIAVNFIILPAFFDRTLPVLENESSPLKTFLVNCLTSKKSSTPYLYFKVADVLPIQNLLENLIWTLLNNPTNKRSINQATMSLLMLQLLNVADRAVSGQPEDEIVMRTLGYIEAHYREGSLTALAESLHYDAAWLSREIKRRTGKTYTQLLQEKRMLQAAYLLKNTDINIDEIAAGVGYENISYFHRLFYATYRITPKQYRSSK